MSAAADFVIIGGGSAGAATAARLAEAGRDVILVEDIIDSGLTLSWIKSNLESRGPASVEICTLLRKPEAARASNMHTGSSS